MPPSSNRSRTVPNVLFLCSDQHQAAASGCYGHPQVHTPNIDRLAGQGVRFERAYCQSPVCVPARGSIITGLYPHAHGARLLADPLPEKSYAIARHFGSHGYQTAAVGKMHFVDETRKHGFHHRVNELDFRGTLTDESWRRIRADQSGGGSVDGRPSSLSSDDFQDTFFACETVRYLEEIRDPNAPFVLWSSFTMPHTPLVPLKSFCELYEPGALALPERTGNELEGGFEGHLVRAKERGWYAQTDEDLRRSLAGYYGNISQMDANLGLVLKTLSDLGLEDNTLIVYTSDHGEMAGAHRMWTKHNMFEQSVRVPLILKLPGTAQPESSDALIEHVDLFPTLSELCGLPRPEHIHGRSFAPLLRNEPFVGQEYAYSEYDFCHSVFTRDDRYVGGDPIRMVRTDRWKLNHLHGLRSELFDLERDPSEFHNVIDDPRHSGLIEELTKIVNRLADC